MLAQPPALGLSSAASTSPPAALRLPRRRASPASAGSTGGKHADASPTWSRFRGVSTDARSSTGTPPPVAGPPVGELGAYGPVGRSRWLDVDWRAHQRWMVIDGQAVNTIELGAERRGEPAASASRSCSSTACPAAGPTGSSSCPCSRASIACSRSTCPALAYSPMPAEQISISGYARLLDRLLGELEHRRGDRRGQLHGRLHRSRARDRVPAARRAARARSPPRASRPTGHPGPTRALPALRRLETVLVASGAWVASKSETVARRARLREAAAERRRAPPQPTTRGPRRRAAAGSGQARLHAGAAGRCSTTTCASACPRSPARR